MTAIHKKLAVAAVVLIGAVSYLAFAGAKQGLVNHLQVDQFTADVQYRTQRVRVCGTVGDQDFVSNPGGLTASFVMKGVTTQVPVTYHGVIPDLFSAGKEVVVEGKLDSAGVFQADVLMTKCASKYESHGKKPAGMGGSEGES
ncbi:MAG TPA: cytochrome c maturation protein CcmE [Tepidisphaeraceae bacterium]|jgi:cytochrome c-type biogenesis protein CcmE